MKPGKNDTPIKIKISGIQLEEIIPLTELVIVLNEVVFDIAEGVGASRIKHV